MNSKRDKKSVHNLIRLRGIDRLPRGIICDPGFKLLGTPLGFVGAKNPGLLFFSNIDEPLPSAKQRVLGTSPLVKSIQFANRNMDALALDFERIVRLGRMELRLVPAGLGTGSSLLEIKFKNRTILYCGGVRMAEPLGAPPVDIVPCDLLLLDTPVADPRPPAPKNVSRKLFQWVGGHREENKAPVVVCGSNGAMLDAAWTFTRNKIQMVAQRGIYEKLRRLAHGGVPQGGIVRLNQQWPTNGVVLFSKRAWELSAYSKKGGLRVAYAGPGNRSPQWADTAFRFGEREDRKGLISFAKQTGAKQVALGPRCDKVTAQAFEKAGFKVHFLEEPVQLPLPI